MNTGQLQALHARRFDERAAAQKLSKRQKRAAHDARTAWRHMTTADRVQFLDWIAEGYRPARTKECATALADIAGYEDTADECAANWEEPKR